VPIKKLRKTRLLYRATQPTLQSARNSLASLQFEIPGKPKVGKAEGAPINARCK
jgi:hypothetical protein